jgi:cytoskeleton protein RodZ
MKITGELLKNERNRKNLSVQDVAFSLKLSSKIVNAIEAGQTDKLPAKTFIRGFVKSYAQLLKLDVDLVMRQFQEEMGTTHPFPKSPPPPPMSENLTKKQTVSEEKSTPSEDKKKSLNESKSNHSAIYISAAVVLVILIVTINKVVDRYQKEAVVDTAEISKVQPLEPNTSTTPTNTSTPAVVADKPAEAPAAATESVPEPPVAVAQPTTPAATSPSAITEDSSAAAILPQSMAESGFEPSKGKPIEIIIEAKKDLELSYARGNTKAFSTLKMLSKQIQVIRSPTGLHLKADDGGAFNIVVNGVAKGPAGVSNKPIRLSF